MLERVRCHTRDTLQSLLPAARLRCQLYLVVLLTSLRWHLQYILPPAASFPLELWTNACVCATADAKRIVPTSNAMRHGKCGDGSKLGQKFRRGITGLRPGKISHFPGIYLSRIWIWIRVTFHLILRYALFCFIFPWFRSGVCA